MNTYDDVLPIKPSRAKPRDLKPDREGRVKNRTPRSDPYKRPKSRPLIPKGTLNDEED